MFVDHDWTETHHDVFVENADGQRLARARLPEGIEGVARFHELIAAHAEDPEQVVVATETDRGLFVGARRRRLHGVGGEPDVGGPPSGAAFDLGSVVRLR